MVPEEVLAVTLPIVGNGHEAYPPSFGEKRNLLELESEGLEINVGRLRHIIENLSYIKADA
jgi:hypothetical protein